MSRIIGDEEIMPRLQSACLNDLSFSAGGLDVSDLAEIAGVFNLPHTGTRASLRNVICSALYPDNDYPLDEAPAPAPALADGFTMVKPKTKPRRSVQRTAESDRAVAERIKSLAYQLFEQISRNIDDMREEILTKGFGRVFKYKDVVKDMNKPRDTHYTEAVAEAYMSSSEEEFKERMKDAKHDLQHRGIPYSVLMHGPLQREHAGEVLPQRDIVRVLDLLNDKYSRYGVHLIEVFTLKHHDNELWAVYDMEKWSKIEEKIKTGNDALLDLRRYIRPTRSTRFTRK